MSENVIIPYVAWKLITDRLEYLTKIVEPLARNYKPPKWMSKEEVLEALKIKDRRLRELKASGKIRYRQPAGGRVTEYWRDDIERYKAGELVISSKE